MLFKLLAVGDIVGAPGRATVRDALPRLVQAHEIDFVVANAENITSGSGITVKSMDKLLHYGVDVITSGDHIWKRMEITAGLKPGGRLLRPANYPPGCPGRGWTVVKSSTGVPVAVINVQGRLFMEPIDCPYRAVDEAIEEVRKETSLVFVDFHAEASSEKVAMGWHLDGRVTAVWGTHTHIQTADEQVLPNGTAYISDLGMTGAHRSVLGRKIEPVLYRFTRQLPARFDIAEEDLRLCGVVISVNTETGKAIHIERVQAHCST